MTSFCFCEDRYILYSLSRLEALSDINLIFICVIHGTDMSELTRRRMRKCRIHNLKLPEVQRISACLIAFM
jgi:hypothetical protein